MRRSQKTLIVLAGLACAAAIIVGYNIATNGLALDIPGASEMPAISFSDSVAEPSRLIIPKLNIDAHVKQVGVDQNGDMSTPGNATDVAWYKFGPHPGMPGSAVIDGHLSTKYVKEAVFYNLRQLQLDDEVQVRTVDGQTIAFKVTRIEEYAEDVPAGEIFNSKDGKHRLNLISCAGDWDPVKRTYTTRIIIFTERVS